MLTNFDVRPILRNDSLTRGLADPEARLLVEWLVRQAEQHAGRASCETQLHEKVQALCHRARSISRFVSLWNDPKSRGSAYQLAATERFCWPLPTVAVDPYELMLDILAYEMPEDG